LIRIKLGVALLRIPDHPGIAARLFEIARQDLDVDLIIQSIHEGNTYCFYRDYTILKRSEVATAIAPSSVVTRHQEKQR